MSQGFSQYMLDSLFGYTVQPNVINIKNPAVPAFLYVLCILFSVLKVHLDLYSRGRLCSH